MEIWRSLIKTHIIACLLIFVSASLAIFSMWKDSSIRDEMPHIVAGYSYLTKLDYRINPEHPPLIKELSAIPLLLMGKDVYFPYEDISWKDRVNDQWALGDKFLYRYGNDADKMLFWGRIPMVLVFLLGGWFLYRFAERLTRKREVALIALVLYLFSPNLLAHGRFITTDMGMTVFSIFAFYSYYLYLEKPSKKRLLWAGLVFGLAQLAKFSAVMLIPPFFAVAFFYGLGVYRKGQWKNTLREIGSQLGKVIVIMAIGYLLVGLWYAVHLWGMPLEVQHRLINESIASTKVAGVNFQDVLHTLTESAIFRPYAQYLLGFFMVTVHATVGHTTFFFGEVGKNWEEYFVFAYFLKEPLAAQGLFYFASLVFLLEAIRKLFRKKNISKGIEKSGVKIAKKKENKAEAVNRKETLAIWLRENAVLLGYAVLALIIFGMSSINKLQLGIRYIVPIFPFLYLFTAYMLFVFWEKIKKKNQLGLYFFNVSALLVLLVWYIGVAFATFPSYLAYFNETIGGSKDAWKYLVDSNLDWGQDLVRLQEFVDESQIKNIKVDYFGGGNLDYYLGENYEGWWPSRGPATGWFALSASPIQWNSQETDENSYRWLTENYTPIRQIGYSIFVYYVPEEK